LPNQNCQCCCSQTNGSANGFPHDFAVDLQSQRLDAVVHASVYPIENARLGRLFLPRVIGYITNPVVGSGRKSRDQYLLFGFRRMSASSKILCGNALHRLACVAAELALALHPAPWAALSESSECCAALASASWPSSSKVYPRCMLLTGRTT
jgi:hypothetical protein